MNPRQVLLSILIGVTVLIALLAAGCGPQPLPEEPTAIPTLAAKTRPETEEPAEDLARRGAAVFSDKCSACHNVSAEDKVGPGLAGLFDREALPNGDPLTDDSLKDWILSGGGDMPPIDVADEDLTALLAYLKEATVVRGTVPQPDQPSAEQGQIVFDGQCAVCHLLTDQEKIGPGLAGLFDRDALPNGNPVTDDNLKEWIRSGGGAMPGFPTLSDGDVEALIIYLKEATAP